MENKKLIVFILWAAIGAGAQPQGSVAALPGVRLWYLDSGGKGTPVVFLHAATGTSASWEKQMLPFTAAGYRVIAFDRRGWGRTELDPSGPQPGTAAGDLEKLMDHLKIDRFHLVGTAAGGFAAIDFGLSFPKRVRSLVLTHTIGGITDPEYVELGRKLRPAQFDALPAHLRELGPAYRAADPEGTERWLALERASRPDGPRAPAQPMKNQATLALLEKIQAPVLLISGGADMYAPPAVMQQLARRIHHSQFVNIPDAGHSGYWETPEQYNREILQFLRKH